MARKPRKPSGSPGDIYWQNLEQLMNRAGEAICERMRQRLTDAGHIDTGALRDSIRQSTERNGDTVTTRIYADAQGNNGAMYAEFIEMGTGAAHGRPGGRVGTWRYKDRNGNWHTTDGMDADPFIEPSVQEYVPKYPSEFVGEFIGQAIDAVFDIAKYGRMKDGGLIS